MLCWRDALRDDAAGRRRVAHQSSLPASYRKPPRSAWIMQPPPDWQTLLNGIIFTPQREADHYAKTTGREPRSILMSSR